MFIKKKLKYFTRPKQISPDLSGVSGDFRIVCMWRHIFTHYGQMGVFLVWPFFPRSIKDTGLSFTTVIPKGWNIVCTWPGKGVFFLWPGNRLYSSLRSFWKTLHLDCAFGFEPTTTPPMRGGPKFHRKSSLRLKCASYCSLCINYTKDC